MLLYTAELKRPMAEGFDVKQRVVNDVLHSLGLVHVRASKIGDPMHRGISGGQAKRVNIGIALVTEPKILFLDEVRVVCPPRLHPWTFLGARWTPLPRRALA